MKRVNEFTIEVYKADRRRKTGQVRVETLDVTCTKEEAEMYAAERITSNKMTYAIHNTYHDVRNLMSGKIVKERYDTPYYMSVGSETYWSA